MKRFILLIIGNIILFALLRVVSVVIAFLFGIGASASSEKYNPYILIPALILQCVLIFLIYKKRKFIETGFQMFFIMAMILILYIVGELELIPF